MAKQPDITRLRRLVDFIRDRKSDRGDEDIRAFIDRSMAEALATIDGLVASEGARYRQSGCGYSLRMAAVNTSCTSGPAGLLLNWRNAAERRISQAEGTR